MTQTQRSINYELAERAWERSARMSRSDIQSNWQSAENKNKAGRPVEEARRREKKCEVASSCVWVDVSERQSGSERKVALGQVGVTLLFKHTESCAKKKKMQLTKFLCYNFSSSI